MEQEFPAIQGEEERINNFAADNIDQIEDSWEALQESVRLLKAGKDASPNLTMATM